jgi:branched-chain amino acid transport system substrate-binding protein
VKKFRILAVMLVSALLVSSLASCGGTSASGAVKVGILAPLTGDVAQYGIAVSNGAKLYLDEFNAKGGLQIEYVEYDEEGDPAKAVTGYNHLVDQGITALIGDVTTTPTLAVVEVAKADNMPMITASATAASVTYDAESDAVNGNVFRSCFIDPFQGTKMASFVQEKLSAKTAAVLFCSEDDYSIGLKDSFVEQAGRIGLEVVSTEAFAKGATDFQAQLTNIAAKAPDVLFISYYYGDVALAAAQAKEAGVSATLIGADGWAGIMEVLTDPGVIEGAYYCSGYSSDDTTPAVQEFIKSYQAKYGEVPNMFAAQGYDAAKVIVNAVQKAVDAKLQPGSAEFKQAVIDNLKATSLDCVTGHITYDEYNNPEKDAVIINVKGGVETFWGKY